MTSGSIASIAESKNLFGEMVLNRVNIDRELLARRLFKIFSKLTIEELVSMITNEFDETMAYLELLNGAKTCQKTSLLFNPHRLDTGTCSSKNSLFYAIKNEESFSSGLARAVIFKHGKVNELLYQVLQLGINGIQYVNEFPPHVAKKICIEYGINSSSKILDPCAGWGGRLIGISTMCNNYTGFEPCTKTHSGLLKIVDFIKNFRTPFNGNIINAPFEDCMDLIDGGGFDLAITSPPYYDTELYSDEYTNSCNRYQTFEEWSENFYIPLIKKTMRNLKNGAPFILNIGSRRYPLNEILLNYCQNEKFFCKKIGNLLSGKSGLGKSGEGEMFYEVRK